MTAVQYWHQFLIAFTLYQIPKTFCWSPSCNYTEFLLLDCSRPDTLLIPLIQQQQVLPEGNLGFSRMPESTNETSCDGMVELLDGQLGTVLTAKDPNCSVLALFDCEESKGLAAGFSDAFGIAFLDASDAVSARAAFARSALPQFLQYYNISQAGLFCLESPSDAFLSAFCQTGDSTWFSTSILTSTEPNICVDLLTLVCRFSGAFILAMPVGQFQRCITTVKDVLQNCSALFLVTPEQEDNSNMQAVIEQLPSMTIIHVRTALLADWNVTDNSTVTTTPKTVSDLEAYRAAQRFNYAWTAMLAGTPDRVAYPEFSVVFSISLESGEMEVLATMNSANDTTLQLVDQPSYQSVIWPGTCPHLSGDDTPPTDSTYTGIVYGMIMLLVLILLSGIVFYCRTVCISKSSTRRTDVDSRSDAVIDKNEATLLTIPAEEVIPLPSKAGAASSRSFAYSIANGTTNDVDTSPEIHLYRQAKVWVKQRELSYYFIPEGYHLTFLKKVKALNHPNIANLRGIVLSTDPLVYEMKFVMEYCPRGSLYDLIGNDAVDFTPALQVVIIRDITNAMVFLHQSFMVCHGSLKSTNCLINDRFNVKITDYGLNIFPVHPPALAADESLYRLMLWTAPEILRGPIIRFRKGTKQGDVFSFAVILYEIMAQSEPYHVANVSILTPKEIIKCLIERQTPAFRMNPPEGCTADILNIMVSAWAEQPQSRPTFKEILSRLDKIPGFSKSPSYLDYLIDKMTHYSTVLEHRVHEATKTLLAEQKMSDELLAQMMPRSVLDKLKSGQGVDPETFEQVTIGFTAVTDFARFVLSSTPFHVVDFLNGLYYLFDEIVVQFDVYKVETVQESYVLASGLPIRNEEHASEVAKMGLKMFQAARNYSALMDDGMRLKMGVHTGSCVAGVIGQRAPRYCLFGDTINTASRMCSIATADEFVVSESTQTTLQTLCPGLFKLVSRGETEVKGKGKMKTFALAGMAE